MYINTYKCFDILKNMENKTVSMIHLELFLYMIWIKDQTLYLTPYAKIKDGLILKLNIKAKK